jgi:hypothetical protein
MTPPLKHQAGCTLDPVHWLRHAIAAAGLLARPHPDDAFVDRTSAEAMTDTLAYYAQLDEWANVTLKDVAYRSTLMSDGRFDYLCTCGAATTG